MSILAADDMEGRETGTRGFNMAAAYVVAQLRSYGVTPGADQYLQQLTVRRSRVDEANTFLRLLSGREARTLKYGEDFVTYGVQREEEDTSVVGDLVFAGDGITVPGLKLDAYWNLNQDRRPHLRRALVVERERAFFLRRHDPEGGYRGGSRRPSRTPGRCPTNPVGFACQCCTATRD